MSTTPKLDAIIECYDYDQPLPLKMLEALEEIREHLQRIPQPPPAERYPSEAETRLLELLDLAIGSLRFAGLDSTANQLVSAAAAIKRDLGLS
jgi:hypothetical protein